VTSPKFLRRQSFSLFQVFGFGFRLAHVPGTLMGSGFRVSPKFFHCDGEADPSEDGEQFSHDHCFGIGFAVV
jgi:hypothetical protein